MDRFDHLLDRAISRVEGDEANRALWNIRMELEPHHSTVVCYEIVLSPTTTWGAFLTEQIPRLTEHLAAKGLPTLGCPSAVVSIWRAEKMFMFTSLRLFEAILEIESMSRDELLDKIGDWRAGLGLPRDPGAAAGAEPPSPMEAVPRERSLALPPVRRALSPSFPRSTSKEGSATPVDEA